MVPRWRDIHATPAAELRSGTHRKSQPGHLLDLEEKRASWVWEPSAWTASDLLATVPFAGRDKLTDQAARLLLSLDHLPDGVRRQVSSYIGRAAEPHAGDISAAYHRATLNSLKTKLRTYPANPLLHVEAARQYVTLGQGTQAEAAFRRALALAPHNRYVIRSAVRFYLHTRELDRAWAIVKDSPTDDPWIVASRITVAELADKPLDSLRSARTMIEGKDPGQTTELSAAVGTLELSHGSFKLARKLFRDSAKAPTDNTVAQLRWARDSAGIPFDEGLLETDLSFEARAGQSNQNTDWGEALKNARLWQLDEPFSNRSANFGCFLSAEILRDFDATEEIATLALLSMPGDPAMLNNRAYARISKGDLAGGESDLVTALGRSPDEAAMVLLEATQGCYQYRSGNSPAGAAHYQRAVELAVAMKDVSTCRIAYIHWVAEDIRAGGSLPADELEALKKTLLDGKDVNDRTVEVLRVNFDAAEAERAHKEDVKARALASVANFRSSAAAQFRILAESFVAPT